MVIMNMTRGVWNRVVLIELKTRNNTLAIRLGADDPDDLTDKNTLKAAKALAKRKGFKTVRGTGNIKLNGQNELAQKVFYYAR